MTAFDMDLKRAFAEAHDPADDAFVVAVSDRVEKLERSRALAGKLRLGAFGVAGLATAFGVVQMAQSFGLDLMAWAGLELAKAHGAMSQSEVGVSGQLAEGLSQGLSMGLTQFLIFAAVALSGAYAWRQAR